MHSRECSVTHNTTEFVVYKPPRQMFQPLLPLLMVACSQQCTMLRTALVKEHDVFQTDNIPSPAGALSVPVDCYHCLSARSLVCTSSTACVLRFSASGQPAVYPTKPAELQHVRSAKPLGVASCCDGTREYIGVWYSNGKLLQL